MSAKKTEISSYEKGIQKLLEKKDGFEWIIANYIIDTHNKFRSNVFPTTQIAKIVMNKLGRKKTQYAILHKIVREIFKIYEKEEVCTLASELSSKSSKKTKRVYQITEYGFKVLRSKIINFNIKSIEGNIDEEFEPDSVSREDLLMAYVQDVFDEFDDLMESDDEFEEEDDE